MSFLPPCRCGGSWIVVTPVENVVVICEQCRNIAHPVIAARVAQSSAS